MRDDRIPPWPEVHSSRVEVHNISDERRVLWNTIARPATIRAEGKKLWGTLTEFNKYWPDFRSYIAQARLYDDAAEHMQGASSALLAYYSALNLAKAELLRLRPEEIYEEEVHHGLTYGPSKRSIKVDYITTRPGVFPMLYGARTGLALKPGEQLPILRLLANVSDVSHELRSAGLAAPQVGQIHHSIVSNYAGESWSIFAFADAGEPPILKCRETRRFLGDHFEEIISNDYLRSTIFRFSSFPTGYAVQAKRVYTESDNEGGGLWEKMLSDIEALVRPIQGHRVYGNDEWAPSLRRTKWLPMPPDLARYAAMYYCSSVVRYRPSLLHDDSEGNAAWILNTFVTEARLLLLRSVVEGITGQHLELHQADRL